MGLAELNAGRRGSSLWGENAPSPKRPPKKDKQRKHPSSSSPSLDPVPIAATQLYQLSKETRRKFKKAREGMPRMRAAAKEYRIVDASPSSISVNNELLEGYLCATTAQGNWFLVFPEEPDKIQPSTHSYILNGARKELKTRQNSKRALIDTNVDLLSNGDQLVKTPVDHEENILFFLANWGKIAKKLYKDEIPIKQHLPRLHEVELNDYGVIYDREVEKPKRKTCGSIDFLGFGPDRQGIIIDFGDFSTRKANQVRLQTLAMQAVITDANHTNPSPPITAYIGEYSRQEDLHIVRLRRPKLPPAA